MNNSVWAERREIVEAAIPSIFDHDIVLYIGANKDSFGFGDELRATACFVDVVEIDGTRCKEIENLGWIDNVIHGDITKIADDIDDCYDAIMWLGGPSAVADKSVALRTIKTLSTKTSDLFLVMVPYGERQYTDKQISKMEREYPLHYDWMRSTYDEKDFPGWDTLTIGDKDGPTSSFWAWRRNWIT